MRILTVRQPWAWAIMHGGKDLENRVRNIAGDYRGLVAIHAAKSDDYAALKHPELIEALAARTNPEPWRMADLPRGVILGTVDLTDLHDSGSTSGRCDTDTHTICSEWAEHGQVHLELANPRPLAEPIPYRGALGMRRLDQNTIDLITAALAADTERTTTNDEPDPDTLLALPSDFQHLG